MTTAEKIKEEQKAESNSMAEYVGIGIIVSRDSINSRLNDQKSAQPMVRFVDIERHKRFTDKLFSIMEMDD